MKQVCLSNESFDSDFIQLFIRLKLILFLKMNSLEKNIDLKKMEEYYIKHFDILNVKFDPYLFDNFIKFDIVLTNKILKEFKTNLLFIDFNNLFNLTFYLYLYHKISNIIKLDNNNDKELKIKLLKLRHTLLQFTIPFYKEERIIIKNLFETDDEFVIILSRNQVLDINILENIIKYINILYKSIKQYKIVPLIFLKVQFIIDFINILFKESYKNLIFFYILQFFTLLEKIVLYNIKLNDET